MRTEPRIEQAVFALVVWTLLGLSGCGMVIGGGLADDWITYLIGLVWALASIFMLGSGLWLRWPRV